MPAPFPLPLARPLAFLVIYLIAWTGSVSAQQINARSGVNLRGTGFIINSPLVTAPNSMTAQNSSWEFSPSLQGRMVPVGNFTGLNSANRLINYEDLLPLKVTKLRVMQGVPGWAPTGVGTVIDSAGIDTNSLITDALYLVDPATQQPLPLATVVNGVVTFAPNVNVGSASSLVLPSSLTLRGAGANHDTVLSSAFPGALQVSHPTANLRAINQSAVALGGSHGVASGVGSVILGGGSLSQAPPNQAVGSYSVIIGSYASRVESPGSAIISSSNSQIKLGARSLILGGEDHLVNAAASAVLGGVGHQIASLGRASAIIAGTLSRIDHAPESVIIGGHSASIGGSALGNWSQNFIGGGRFQTIADGTALSAILGGYGHRVKGWRNVALGGDSARVDGTDNVAIGWNNQAAGWAQLVMGRFNQVTPSAALVIGNGTSDADRRNALTVDFEGNVEATGRLRATVVETPSLKLTAPQGNISMGAFTDP